MKSRIFVLIFGILLSSCSFGNENKELTFLNYKYTLKDAGDLHGLEPTSNEMLNRNTGFTSYTNLFDKERSYINFQCYGSSYDSFYCETTFCLCDKNGNNIIGGEDFKFNTSYNGGQAGTINIENEEKRKILGTIYVYTPYWCRWQYEYDVNGDGNKTLLTFEFWKSSYNDLPDW